METKVGGAGDKFDDYLCVLHKYALCQSTKSTYNHKIHLTFHINFEV